MVSFLTRRGLFERASSVVSKARYDIDSPHVEATPGVLLLLTTKEGLRARSSNYSHPAIWRSQHDYH